MADFFDDKVMDQQSTDQSQPEQLPEAIKIGDKAYTQEELQNLVGLGESARELETKWNTKLDRLMPEYTKFRQQISDYEKREQERQTQQVQQKVNQGQSLTADEAKAEAARQLKELMKDPAIQQELQETYFNNQAAQRLLDDSEFVLNDYAEQGFEAAGNVTVDDLLTHMAATGIKNPEKALKDMLEPEYEAWRASQLNSLKPSGMTTIQGSSAGSKVPVSQGPINRSQMQQMIHDLVLSANES